MSNDFATLNTARILVVDDDPKIQAVLRRGLRLEGYQVEVAADGPEALATLRAEFDLLVLDLSLPGLDGLAVCRRVREVMDIPILMLTARDTVSDKVSGLESGADDYLVKPFALEELLARVRALLRRRAPQLGGPHDGLSYADLVLNPVTRETRRAGKRLELTAKEFDLLEFFLRHPRHVLTREQIFRAVWGSDFLGGSNVIDVYIRSLREKLETDAQPRLLHTLRGVGYSLRHEP